MEELFEKTQAALLVPMIYKKTLTGIIALGEKKSGELFVHEDMELLLTIANQSAVAFENAASIAGIDASESKADNIITSVFCAM